MRMRFIPTISLIDAREAAPWACKIIRVSGGWLALESLGDWRAWQRQR